MTFHLLEEAYLADIQSQGVLYQHEESGSQLLFLKNEDSNKAFTIAFKTLPETDNGIAHILEHSVLNGSRKFPSKEPFVELLKGSLKTYANALTGSDRTMYPIASTNQQDFLNLMTVYLDAVFAPNLYQDRQILQQEGWHYHLENREDDLIIKGVVYNEMKGANASPESQLYRMTIKNLYPGTVYTHNSGGISSVIPTLTQESFVQFHQTYYHPSNALTVVYGDFEEGPVFDLLEEYLSGKGQVAIQEIVLPEAQELTRHEASYSLAASDEALDKDYLSLAWHVGTWEDRLDKLGLMILGQILLGYQQSPLKKVLLEAGLGKEISGGFGQAGLPTFFSVTIKHGRAEDLTRFADLVRETLTDLVSQGLDSLLVQSTLNSLAFSLKEAVISEGNPKGIGYTRTAFSDWLYGGNPLEALTFTDRLEQLTELAKSGYFEDLIKRKLLDNHWHIQQVLRAEPGKSDREEASQHAALQAYKARLSLDELDQLVADTQALLERQTLPDKPEDLAKIPRVSRQDLSAQVEDYPLTETTLPGFGPFYQAPHFTSGIDYLQLRFDVRDLPIEDYPYLELLTNLLTNLPTQSLTASQLRTQIDLYTGGISSTLSLVETGEGDLLSYIVLEGKALTQSVDSLIDLMIEIFRDNRLDLTTLRHQIKEEISDFEQAVTTSSHVLAAYRGLSRLTAYGKAREMISGIDYAQTLKQILADLEAGGEEAILTKLREVWQSLFNRQRLSILFVGDPDRSQLIQDQLSAALDFLPSQPLGQPSPIRPNPLVNEAFVTAQDVNYVSKVADTSSFMPITGPVHVLQSLIRFDYLWNKIRVQGGAYGAITSHSRSGNFLLASYRDPNLAQTLSVYDQLPDYIASLELSDEELTKYLIGTISDLERPLSAYTKGTIALERRLKGLTVEELSAQKAQVLASNQADLLDLAPYYQQALEQATVTVIGNQAKIAEAADLFDTIVDLY